MKCSLLKDVLRGIMTFIHILKCMCPDWEYFFRVIKQKKKKEKKERKITEQLPPVGVGIATTKHSSPCSLKELSAQPGVHLDQPDTFASKGKFPIVCECSNFEVNSVSDDVEA